MQRPGEEKQQTGTRVIGKQIESCGASDCSTKVTEREREAKKIFFKKGKSKQTRNKRETEKTEKKEEEQEEN